MNQSKSEYYFFVTSLDSLAYFPFNTSCDFQVELPESIHLTGTWTCALTQIGFKEEISEDLIVLCDLFDSSFVRNTRLPVARVISQLTNKVITFDEPYRLGVSRDEIRRFRVFIRTFDLEKPSFIQKPVTCTFHLRRE